jgi:hypothetical protein
MQNADFTKSAAAIADPLGQTWLPGVPAPAYLRVADVGLQRLCSKFIEQYPATPVGSLPVELDDLTLACLLMAFEWGASSPAETTNALNECMQKAGNRFWFDRLPWQLAIDFCTQEHRGANFLDELTASFDHHNSSIRMWMFDVGWCVRQALNPVEAVPRLMKNVADTLGHWDASLGLCRSFFPTDEAFWQAANEFQPEDLADQYRQRMELTHKEGLRFFQRHFERRELRVRQLINQSTLGLTKEEIKIVNLAQKAK